MRAALWVALCLVGCAGGGDTETDSTEDHDLDDDGFWGNLDDCDDTDPEVNPDAWELCNGIDDDCDGSIDVGAIDAPPWYRDGDGDGHGRPNLKQEVCTRPDGYVELGDDCDDDEATVHPGLEEVCGDLLDNDCDGNAGPCGLGGEEALAGSDAFVIGDTNGGRLGDGVFGVGDPVGSGKAHVAFGAPRADREGNDNAGKVYLLAGPLSGELDLSTAAAVIVGQSISSDAGAELGCDVAYAGDVTGDGVDDLLVDSSTTGAYVFAGPLTGTVFSERAHANVRRGTEGCGGVAGLGVVAGTGERAIGIADGGGVAVISGDPRGIGSTAGAPNRIEIGAPGAGDAIPASVAGPGDVDGDGLDDVLVGLASSDAGGTNAGAAWLVLGPATGVTVADEVDAKMIGEDAGDEAGYSAAGPADVNGDGYADLFVGAPGFSGGGSDSGGAYVVFGKQSGESNLVDADIRLVGISENDRAGVSVAALDLDADGSTDLAIGAPFQATGGAQAGAVYVIYGPTDGGLVDLFYAEWKLYGDAGIRAGEQVGSARDTDADGFDDLLIGAPRGGREAGTSGAAYLFRGGPGI